MSNLNTNKLAVFGSPIKHSLSPYIHEIFAQQFSLDISYERILVEGPFSECASKFFQEGGIGCNITMPCKIDAYNLADELSDSAKIAHAVNTLKKLPREDGSYTLLGDNTDGYGFYYDLKRLGCNLASSNILIIGAGGACRGILPPLLNASNNIKSINVVSRDKTKVSAIFDDLKVKAPKLFQEGAPKLEALSYDELNNEASLTFDVIINATSLSVNSQLPPIADVVYKNAHFAYDLFYTKVGSTVFIEKAKSLGVSNSHDGLGMLVGQAALSFELWFNQKPDINDTMEQMRKLLTTLQ